MPTDANPLRFVHISDTHINPNVDYNPNQVRYAPIVTTKALVRAVNDLPFEPDFILHTGDVAYDPVAEVYPALKPLLQQFKAPVHYLAGNHDDGQALQRIIVGRGEDEIQDYLYYEFDAKGVQVVCLDSNGPHHPEHPSGTVTPEQLAWLEAICTGSDARPLVLAVHHNPIAMGVPWLDNWMMLENGEAFHAIVRQAHERLRGVFFGHIHQNIEVLRDGVLYVAAASSWYQIFAYPIPENTRIVYDSSAPPGFSVVTITGERTFIRRHSFSVTEDT